MCDFDGVCGVECLFLVWWPKNGPYLFISFVEKAQHNIKKYVNNSIWINKQHTARQGRFYDMKSWIKCQITIGKVWHCSATHIIKMIRYISYFPLILSHSLSHSHISRFAEWICDLVCKITITCPRLAHHAFFSLLFD